MNIWVSVSKCVLSRHILMRDMYRQECGDMMHNMIKGLQFNIFVAIQLVSQGL